MKTLRWKTVVFCGHLLLLLNTALAQGILKEHPGPSREPWGPIGLAHGRDYSTSEVTKVIVLGGGTPLPNAQHDGISVAVIVNGTPYIFDCGPGFWRSSQSSTPYWGGKFKALEAPNLTRLFLTHLHFDHAVGLPSFILFPYTNLRTENPQIFGPPGTERMVKGVIEAYQKDIDLQMFGLERTPPTGYRAVPHDVLPGQVYKDKNIEVIAFENAHGSWDFTYGYRIVTPDRTIVLGGDTAPFDRMEQVYAGADILLHEAYSWDPETEKDVPVNVPYMQAFHTTTKQLAEVLKKVKPKVTVLYHYIQFKSPGSPGYDDERGVKEIKSYGYNGVVIQSQDQDIY